LGGGERRLFLPGRKELVQIDKASDRETAGEVGIRNADSRKASRGKTVVKRDLAFP